MHKNTEENYTYTKSQASLITYLAGVGIFVMLAVAAVLIGFAIFMMLETRPQIPNGGAPLAFASQETEDSAMERAGLEASATEGAGLEASAAERAENEAPLTHIANSQALESETETAWLQLPADTQGERITPSADGSHVEGSGIDGLLANGSNIDGSLVSGLPVDGSNIDGLPVGGSNIDGLLVDGSNINGLPVDVSGIDGLPVGVSSIDGLPIDMSNIDRLSANGSLIGTPTTNEPITTPPTPTPFPEIPFYIPENLPSYQEFQLERPDLDTETIIWQVNAAVHVPFYSQISINEQPNPLFITPAYRLPEYFAPGELVPVNNEECHLLALPEVVAAFRRLRDTAQAEGFAISATSAYRTAARQSELWENGGRRDGSVARPYHSEHQTGRALDLWGPSGLLDASGPSPAGRWVAENAHKYGFIVRYRAETTHITGYVHEPWHITFVGTEISIYMYENNILSLEEYVGKNMGARLP